MSIIKAFEANGWRPGNLNELVARAHEFALYQKEKRKNIRTLYDIPADYKNPLFIEFLG